MALVVTFRLFMVGLKSLSIYYFASLVILSGGSGRLI